MKLLGMLGYLEQPRCMIDPDTASSGACMTSSNRRSDDTLASISWRYVVDERSPHVEGARVEMDGGLAVGKHAIECRRLEPPRRCTSAGVVM